METKVKVPTAEDKGLINVIALTVKEMSMDDVL